MEVRCGPPSCTPTLRAVGGGRERLPPSGTQATCPEWVGAWPGWGGEDRKQVHSNTQDVATQNVPTASLSEKLIL